MVPHFICSNYAVTPFFTKLTVVSKTYIQHKHICCLKCYHAERSVLAFTLRHLPSQYDTTYWLFLVPCWGFDNTRSVTTGESPNGGDQSMKWVQNQVGLKKKWVFFVILFHNKNLKWFQRRFQTVRVRRPTSGGSVSASSVAAAYWWEDPSTHRGILPQMVLDFDWKSLKLNCWKRSFIGQLLLSSLDWLTFVRLINSQSILPIVSNEINWFIPCWKSTAALQITQDLWDALRWPSCGFKVAVCHQNSMGRRSAQSFSCSNQSTLWLPGKDSSHNEDMTSLQLSFICFSLFQDEDKKRTSVPSCSGLFTPGSPSVLWSGLKYNVSVWFGAVPCHTAVFQDDFKDRSSDQTDWGRGYSVNDRH